MKEEMVTITKKEYDELVKNSNELNALESCGVDNWDGYDIAMEMIHGDEDEG